MITKPAKPKTDAFTLTQHMVPATLCNHIAATIHAEGIRFTFGETPDGSKESSQPRCAIFMQGHTFRAFLNLCMELSGQFSTDNQQAN